MTEGSDSRWVTWANLLSAVRLISVAPCTWAVLAGRWTIAGICFVVAVVTDLIDGPIARHHGDDSPLGGLLDHGSDALFVAATLGALATLGRMPWILPVLIVGAFLQYMLDSRALAGRVLRTSRLGRYNGIAYYVLAGIPIVSEALSLGWPPRSWVLGLGWLLVLSTVLSMSDRARALRARL